MVQPGNIWLNCVNSVLIIDGDLLRVRTKVPRTINVGLTVHFLLLRGTRYRLNFSAHLLTARFATVLKRFYYWSAYTV